jgi:symplekin
MMTTVFRSDIFANAMQRIVDQPGTLPICFMRTVLKAVAMYRSLVPFVANNVVPKLVAKKVWEKPELWAGFVRLVPVLGQASFGALLQMPIEQIRHIVEKSPALKTSLKTWLTNKPTARNQLAPLFAENPEETTHAQPAVAAA